MCPYQSRLILFILESEKVPQDLKDRIVRDVEQAIEFIVGPLPDWLDDSVDGLPE